MGFGKNYDSNLLITVILLLLLEINFFSGAFGVVHRCVEKSTGRTFAAKFVATNNEKDKSMVRREIGVMSELRHPTLINLHDAYEEEHEVVMIYEL